ncbi:HD domain-containing protein [Cryptosporangium aurantiacum]|uniref:HDIG domain-containing protein n=1 Tax=Cryptosporangium aurantiacum TaxID=134849 RepID=A0A1M7MHK6_9ACTN|nr:HD domain-containing protein [Cryptosporangium aurantiacum]SHM90375.1 HDIG domain-containing protein [Cryptosporangium aurantiacum]
MRLPACDFGLEHAEELARTLLPPPAERWFHTAGVAESALQLASTVPPEDRELLVAAAWLHDVGYAGELHDTGFHPLDGARYLDRMGWPLRLTSLVAHHSGARFVAETRGLAAEMARYPVEISPVSDALTYADQTVGPHGRSFTVEQRMAEMLGRHGPSSPQARAHRARAPYLLGVAGRVRARHVTTFVPRQRRAQGAQ